MKFVIVNENDKRVMEYDAEQVRVILESLLAEGIGFNAAWRKVIEQMKRDIRRR